MQSNSSQNQKEAISFPIYWRRKKAGKHFKKQKLENKVNTLYKYIKTENKYDRKMNLRHLNSLLGSKNLQTK